AGTAAAEGYATDATTGTLLWKAVDKRGGTTALAENTLNTWLDVDHAFEAWSEQLASRLQELAHAGGEPNKGGDRHALSLAIGHQRYDEDPRVWVCPSIWS